MNNCQRVPILDRVDGEGFRQIVDKSQPVVLKNCDFGDCMTKWNLDYLTEKLADQEIVIHESSSQKLEFIDKNFRYKKCKFKDFSERLSEGRSNSDSIYLRSTHIDPKAKKAAKIEEDFPAISDDLKPPNFIPFGQDNELYLSSVLRIASANVQVWTHFDTYDNILCQVAGIKRVILFGPEDSQYLYIDGDKSEVNDLNRRSEELWPLLRHTNPRLCYLNPGDCLFIPRLWWHNIRSIVSEDLDPDFGPDERLGSPTDSLPGYSIGFNIFWREKELVNRSLYADGDVYGNKHLKPYELALTTVDKALKHLEKCPEDYKKLYKLLLLKHMMKKVILK
uniref:tRNA wybutosine-synthesizing protein 5 n=1 Tax=Aceria tosichella TaxID=561515 RepID=A0A6G1SFI8_9ACAR